ncbi:MAG: AAA family ATPase [Thermoplasmata archaeon]
MPDLSIVPAGVFTEQEVDLIDAPNVSLLSPQERATRAMLLTRGFATTSVAGTPLFTSLIQQESLARVRNLILNSVNQVADGMIEFPDEKFWPWLLDLLRQTLGRVRTLNEISQSAGLPDSRRPTTHLWDLFGGDPRAWSDIRITQPELVTARYLEIWNPSLLKEVPVQVRRQLESESGIVPGPPPAEESEIHDELRKLNQKVDRINARLARPSGGIPRIEVPRQPEQVPPAPPPPSQTTLGPAPATSQSERSWEVKWRPCHLDDIAGNQRSRNILNGAIRTGVSPAGFVLWGPTGIGKTTAAEAFARDYLQAHGVLPPMSEVSCPKLSDAPAGAFSQIRADTLPADPEQAREVLTERLQSLARYGSLTPGTKRIVVVDDINRLAPSVLDRLRPLLERYTHNVLFLFTANQDPARLFDPAVLGRLTQLKFVAPDQASVDARLRQIAEAEHIAHRLSEAGVQDPGHVTEEMVLTAGQKSKGDVRSAIGILQAEFLSRMGAP